MNLLNLPLKTKLLVFGLIAVIILTTIVLALQSQPAENLPQKTEIPSQNQSTIIGKKITPDVEKRLDLIDKQASSEGTTIYSLNSQNTIRTDQIITQNDQIIFQRTYVPENPNDPNHLLISKMLEKYGEPDKTIQGSRLWGPFMKTYIYNTKGIAFIGNPNTDEVYEFQNFTLISLEEYLQKYGDDIDETPHGGES